MAAAGRLADLYGRRRLFLLGAAVFGLGSVACAAAPNEELLIAARALQGAGGALLIPLGYANATADIPDARHGWAIGIVSTGATVFLALGPLLGGSIVVLIGWRWIFLVNVPVIAAILTIGIRFFPETRGGAKEPLDVKGLGLLVGGLVSVVLALLNMQDWGLTAPVTLALLAAGAGMLTGFVAVERRASHPLIALKLLEIPAVTGSLFALFAIQFAILGLTVYLTLYLQLALGYSPAAAGALTLPTVIVAPFLAVSVGRMTDVMGARALTAGSMLLAAIALAIVGVLCDQLEVLVLLPAFLAFGVARPVATVAGASATVGATPIEARGLASGLVTQSRQIGAVLGVAVLGLVLTGLEISRRDQLLRGVDANFGQHRREALDGILADSSQALIHLRQLTIARRQQVHEAAATAFVAGFRVAMLLTAGLAALAALVSWVLLRPRFTRRRE
jgi:MFS family permease